ELGAQARHAAFTEETANATSKPMSPEENRRSAHETLSRWFSRNGQPPKRGSHDAAIQGIGYEGEHEIRRCAWCHDRATQHHNGFGYCDKHYNELMSREKSKSSKTGVEIAKDWDKVRPQREHTITGTRGGKDGTGPLG